RFAGAQVIINPVRVQGVEAPKEIAEAIRQFNALNLVDVMIVCRGGGSIEDLWAFNEEIVAEAIFNSRIPIVCAVGHETDHCIAEYVADVRAPTPSAAAELIMAEKTHALKFLSQTSAQVTHSILQLLKRHRHGLDGLMKNAVLRSSDRLLGLWMQQLDHLKQ